MSRWTATRLVLVVVMVSLVCGCGTLGEGPTDEERIAETLAQWKATTEAQDLEGMMATYSADFSAENVRGKAVLRETMAQALEEGHFEDAEVDLQDVETVVEGRNATVGPIGMTGVFGAAQIGLDMRKEADGVWRIVGIRQH